MTEPRKPYPMSGEWWQTRTADELEQQIRGNFPGSRIYESAVRERERREGKIHKIESRMIAWVALAVSTGSLVVAIIALLARN